MLRPGDKLWFVNNKTGKIDFITVEKVRKDYFTFESKRNTYRAEYSSVGTKYYGSKDQLLDNLRNRRSLRNGEEVTPVESVSAEGPQDIVIVCMDCGDKFVFSAAEQDFYADKGFKNPVRCPACRKKRKAAK